MWLQTEVVDDRVSPSSSGLCLKARHTVRSSHGEFRGSPNVQCAHCGCQTSPAEHHPLLSCTCEMKITNIRETGSYEQGKIEPDSLRIAGDSPFPGVTRLKPVVLERQANLFLSPGAACHLTMYCKTGLWVGLVCKTALVDQSCVYRQNQNAYTCKHFTLSSHCVLCMPCPSIGSTIGGVACIISSYNLVNTPRKIFLLPWSTGKVSVL